MSASTWNRPPPRFEETPDGVLARSPAKVREMPGLVRREPQRDGDLADYARALTTRAAAGAPKARALGSG
jgi:hypothetical protein